jgi:hypothetical protein
MDGNGIICHNLPPNNKQIGLNAMIEFIVITALGAFALYLGFLGLLVFGAALCNVVDWFRGE